MGLQALVGVGGGYVWAGGGWFQFSRDVACKIFICRRKAEERYFTQTRCVTSALTLSGFIVQRLNVGSSRHHVAHLRIASESSSSRPPASMCVSVHVDALDSTSAQHPGFFLARSSWSVWRKQRELSGEVSISRLKVGNQPFFFPAAASQKCWGFICELLSQLQLSFCVVALYSVGSHLSTCLHCTVSQLEIWC